MLVGANCVSCIPTIDQAVQKNDNRQNVIFIKTVSQYDAIVVKRETCFQGGK